jgi:hypothetical protein
MTTRLSTAVLLKAIWTMSASAESNVNKIYGTKTCAEWSKATPQDKKLIFYFMTYFAGYLSDFRNRLSSCDFEADTPEHALALARQFYDEEPSSLYFESYNEGMVVNEVKIIDPDGNTRTWIDENLTLRLAARDLLEALNAVCDLPADDTGDRTVPAGFLDQARAAIAKAKGGAA